MINRVWHRYYPTTDVERSVEFLLTPERFVQLVGVSRNGELNGRDLEVVINGTTAERLADAVDISLRGHWNHHLVGINFVSHRICLLGALRCYVLNADGRIEATQRLNRSYDMTEYWRSITVLTDERLIYIYEQGLLCVDGDFELKWHADKPITEAFFSVSRDGFLFRDYKNKTVIRDLDTGHIIS